jgi:ubiquinone biosynthesis protein
MKNIMGDDWWRSIGYRLRKAFEELGPSFIKIGQLLASREDIFPQPFIRQMKLLQNKVREIPFEESKKVIEKNLGRKLVEIFSEFNEEPIGVASIGIVYKATLQDGQEVVVKVQRPGIAPIIQNDFDILEFVVGQIERVSEDFKYFGASRILNDFRKSIQTELNYNVEAMNCEKLKTNLSKLDKTNIFTLPNVHKDLTTEQVLVLDYLDGRPFNEMSSDEFSPKLKKNLEKSVGLFIHTLLSDGFFHADLHGGNFFLLEDDKIGLIDFGLMGNLGKKNRINLVAILYALTTNNYETLVYEFLDVAEFDRIPNHEVLIRDIRDALMPHIGLSVQETNVTVLVSAIIATLSKHKIYLPREWFIIFRALMTLDGVGKSVGMDMNIFNIINDELEDIIGEILSKNNATEELMWISRDAINSLRIIPRHVRWFLREFSKKNYALDINIKAQDSQVKSIANSFIFMSHSILAAMFFIGGVLTLENNLFMKFYSIPLLSWIFWLIGGLFLLRGLYYTRLK